LQECRVFSGIHERTSRELGVASRLLCPLAKVLTTKETAMNTPLLHKPPRPFELLRAEDLMRPNPVSLRCDATIREALELLTERGIGAAPVIDAGGRAIGVLSRTDILIHERECARRVPTPEHRSSPYDCTEWDLFPDSTSTEQLSPEALDMTRVAEIMNRGVFTVALGTPAREVARCMLERKVHHLFVSDNDQNLVGVISPLDILRCLAA
jgi:CBS domain-containing protein